MLEVCEIFKSIQGESTRAGVLCTFIRLSRCNLDCSYCDTRYAKQSGENMSIEKVLSRVDALGCKTVEITGGEPLLQADTPALCKKLIESGYTVLVETNGSRDISVLPEGCVRIVDVKTPRSLEPDSFLSVNLGHLSKNDELKFVICDENDYIWVKNFLNEHSVNPTTTILFSPCMEKLPVAQLAQWMIRDNVSARLSLQLHSIIWPKGEPKDA